MRVDLEYCFDFCSESNHDRLRLSFDSFLSAFFRISYARIVWLGGTLVFAAQLLDLLNQDYLSPLHCPLKPRIKPHTPRYISPLIPTAQIILLMLLHFNCICITLCSRRVVTTDNYYTLLWQIAILKFNSHFIFRQCSSWLCDRRQTIQII